MRLTLDVNDQISVYKQPSKVMASATQSHFQTIGGIGAYKDVGSTVGKINNDIELRGSDKFSAASYPHYLPVWDNEKGEK